MESKILWWPFLKQHPARVLSIILVGLITGYCTLLLPLSIGKYMELVFSAGSNKTRALQLLGIHLPEDLAFFFLFFFVILFIKFFSAWAYGYLSSMLGESFITVLRHKLFNYQVQQHVPGTEPAASLLIPFGNDLKLILQLMVNGILGLIKDSLFLFMALYVLFVLQPALSMVVVLMIGLFYGVHRWFNLVYKPLFKQKRKEQSDLLNYVSRVLLGKNLEDRDRSKAFKKRTDKLQAVLVGYHIRKSWLRALTPFMLYLLLALIMVTIIWGLQPGKLQAGEIVTYILLLMTLFPTIRNIIRIEHTWVQGNLAARKFVKASVPPGQKEEISVSSLTNISYPMLHSDTERQL